MDKDIKPNKEPAITVVMPVYNASKYLREAIDSILNQTLSDFILLIINDGSVDNTEGIVLSYNDSRLKYVKNAENIGLKATLNKAIGLTTTKYLARMDADDISLPERLKLQFEFMEANNEIGVCGSCYEIFGTESSKVKLPSGDKEMKACLVFWSVIFHPTVFIRTEVLKNNNCGYGVPFEFNDDFGHKILELEDFALWHKLKSVTKFANLDNILLLYRMEGQNLTTKRLDIILERKKQFYRYILNELGVQPEEMSLLLHISPKNITKSTSPEDITVYKKHLDELIIKNSNSGLYDSDGLRKIINQRWNNLFYYLPSFNYRYVFKYRKVSGGLTKEQANYLFKFTINKYLLRKKI